MQQTQHTAYMHEHFLGTSRFFCKAPNSCVLSWSEYAKLSNFSLAIKVKEPLGHYQVVDSLWRDSRTSRERSFGDAASVL